MITNFSSYSDTLLKAYLISGKKDSVIDRKLDLLDTVYRSQGCSPQSTLFVGFNPAMLVMPNSHVFGLSEWALERITQDLNVAVKPVQQLDSSDQQFDAVVATDDFFTFFQEESAQREFLDGLKHLVKGVVVTSLKDYKNQEFKDREFSFPNLIKNQDQSHIFLEHHEQTSKTRNGWNTQVYHIVQQQLNCYGPFAQKPVYFKQLAKFVSDCGYTNFTIHKNIMFKSLIRKNYEHVISWLI